MPDQNKRSPMPRDLGYSMPAEWAPHRATWLSWPHNLETWPVQLERVREAWVQMILALSPHEKVCLLVNDDPMRQDVSMRLKTAGAVMENVTVIKIPTIDVWMRDYGPTFVVRNQADDMLALNDWIFNGWGGNKYKAYEHDDQVAKSIAELLGVPVFAHPLVLEGGAIEVNGAGICLTTEQCLLNTNRNPHLSRAGIEQFLQDSLGVSQIIWLAEGVVGDDTDGHIDDIARFVDATTIVCAVEDDPKDANYAPLQENLERLQGARDQRGSRFDLITLPSPRPVFCQGSRLPASYANFYIANELVLVPIFDDPGDQKALGVLGELSSTRKAVGIRCTDLVAGLGAIHCVTQQEPQIAPVEGLTISSSRTYS
jgi:agmatine deiminase